ncbi:phosphotriesterase-related protein isoform X3 [Leptidea sinapis]|uniref:phosphotriesterase-related protein isoform X3 n=1 Tax=Leptidea sinapis TaxID=189913 RepID=UPI00213971D3|nr:phosphotriesterase-related protein isoform X3 [Leptidea sinapis]
MLSFTEVLPTVKRVLGAVLPSDLGRTLTHEHLSMEFNHFYRKPPNQIAHRFQSGFTLENVGYIRQYPYSSKFNIVMNDDHSKHAVYNDVGVFKELGGGTIVENTTIGLNRDIDFYKSVSEKTGVHVVAGTGHYIADVQNDTILDIRTEDLYNLMLTELTEGCIDNPIVKAGFVGEIASVWPIKDFERRAIRAAGEIQAQLGCGISFHPHRDPKAPFEIIRLYTEAGGRVNKAVMSHLDRTLLELEQLLEFSELGTYCQLDLFGTEVSHYQLNIHMDMPSDAQRLNMIKALVNEGREERVLMSHDIHTKHRLIDFGGHGYSHIFFNVLPKMLAKGFTQAQIDKITIENPANWLSVTY